MPYILELLEAAAPMMKGYYHETTEEKGHDPSTSSQEEGEKGRENGASVFKQSELFPPKLISQSAEKTWTHERGICLLGHQYDWLAITHSAPQLL